MDREMRRKDRKIENDEAIEILKTGEYGVLSTVDTDGQPYGVPISYTFLNNSIYFHSALKGYKLDNISSNSNVSFCVVGKTEVIPDKFTSKYESVIISGKASEVSGDEKNIALLELINKYSIDHIEKGKNYIQKAINATKVIKINIEHVSGKAYR